MSDEPNPQEERPENVQPAEELSEEEMDKVVGGFNDIKITKEVDKPTPVFYR